MDQTVSVLRQSHTIFLEILPTQPLTHGERAKGNEQVFLRRDFLVPKLNERTGKTTWVVEKIPVISGASLRHNLRAAALENACEMMGLADGSFTKGKLRLLLQGGALGGNGSGPNLEETRRILELFPMLRLFGAMDDNLKITGALDVSSVHPFCAELVAASQVPTERRTVQFYNDAGELQEEERTVPTVWQGDPNDPTWPAFEEPPSMTRISTSVTYYRHDPSSSPQARLLEDGERKKIQDQQAVLATLRATKGAPKATKEERSEANESMPHSFQAIMPGTPLFCVLRLESVTDIEFCTLIHAIQRWVTEGGHLGGGSAKGHGECKVRIAGAFSSGGGIAARQANAISAPNIYTQYSEMYKAHMRKHAEEARKFVGAP